MDSAGKSVESFNTEESGEARLRTSQLIDSMLPRKTSSESLRQPYRKPTQVGRKRILRRTSDLSFRNSANWPRNFGIRGTPVMSSFSLHVIFFNAETQRKSRARRFFENYELRSLLILRDLRVKKKMGGKSGRA